MRASPRTGSPQKDCQSSSFPRWLFVVFLVGLLNAGLFALLTPAWQAPDEPGHYEYACLLGQLRRPLTGDDRSLPLQQAIIASLDRNGFWPLVREAQPDPLPASFAAHPFLLRSARQVGDEPPAYYLAPAGICLLPLAIETQARLMRLYGALLFGLTAAAAAWGWTGGAAPQALARWHPLLLALLPMPAFIAGSVNNDGLALLSATLVFAAALRAERLGWTGRRALGLAALMALALASKKTNLFLLPWAAALALAGLWRWLGRQGWSRRRRLALLLAAGAATAAVLALPTSAPAGWRVIGAPWAASRVRTALPGGAGWAAQVADRAPNRTVRLVNNIDHAGVPALAGQAVTASLLVRSPDGQPVAGRLMLRDAAGASQTAFTAGDRWQPVRVQHTLAITTTYVRLVVFPTTGQATQETGRLLVASAAVQPAGAAGQEASLLRHGDFSAPARLGALLAAPLVDRWRPFTPQAPALGPTPQRSLLYLALTFAGFWGNFGWLQRPLPVAFYALLAAITLAAAAGAAQRWRQDAALRPVMAGWLVAVLLVAAQTFAPMIGRDWQPQGRYLFSALLPISGLLLLGLDQWLDLAAHRRRQAGLALALLAFNALGLAVAAGLW